MDGGWRRWAVGGWWSLGAVPKKKKLGLSRPALNNRPRVVGGPSTVDGWRATVDGRGSTASSRQLAAVNRWRRFPTCLIPSPRRRAPTGQAWHLVLRCMRDAPCAPSVAVSGPIARPRRSVTGPVRGHRGHRSARDGLAQFRLPRPGLELRNCAVTAGPRDIGPTPLRRREVKTGSRGGEAGHAGPRPGGCSKPPVLNPTTCVGGVPAVCEAAGDRLGGWARAGAAA